MTDYIQIFARVPKELVKELDKEMKKRHIATRNQLIVNILVERYGK